jgi:hypothetical protein
VRRRLLFSTLAVAVTAVVLFGLPLAFVLMRLQTNAAHQLVQRDATTVARALENRLRSGLPPDPTDAADAAHSLPDRFVSISRDEGPPITFGGPPGTADVITARAVTKNFRVTVVADDSVATEGVTEALVVTGSLAVLAVVVAVALAMFQARRLARPMQELAGAADRLGSAGAGTAWRSSTGWPRAWTSRRSGSATCSRPSGSSPPTPHISCARR